MSEQWVSFINKNTGKELSAITVEGLFKDEIINTIELLAYENKLEKNEIEVKLKFEDSLEEKERKFEQVNAFYRALIDSSKVNYYWEASDCVPVIEVFHEANAEAIKSRGLVVENCLRVLGVSEKEANISTEMLHENYGRVAIYFDREIDENKLLLMVDILKNFGSAKWIQS